MPSEHALLNPSGAKQRALCPGSLAMQDFMGKRETPSEYAAEGTAAHQLGQWCLESGKDCEAFRGRIIEADGFKFEVGDEMIEHVQTYVDNVRQYADGNPVMAEVRVCHAPYLGVADHLAWGTSDAIVIADSEIQVHDLKYGKGVPVSPEENEQAIAYALGALRAVEDILGDVDGIERVRVVIHQPRAVKAPLEWDVTVKALLETYAPRLAESEQEAQRLYRHMEIDMRIDTDVSLVPGEEQCRFCRAKAECPSLRRKVAAEVAGDFKALDDPEPLTDETIGEEVRLPGEENLLLAAHLQSVPLIRQWCDAIEKAAEAALHRGEAVPGFKLVEGKRGNRKWSSEQEVEDLFKSMRLKQDEMYKFTLITPTVAEKLLKETPKRWAKVQALITQSEGSPTVAPVSDKRPALVITPPSDDFENLDTPEGADEFV